MRLGHVSAFDARRATKWAVDYALKTGMQTNNPFLSTEAANLKATVAIGFKGHANLLSEGAIGTTALDDVYGPITTRRNFPMPFGIGEIARCRNDDLNLAVVNDEVRRVQYSALKRIFHTPIIP